jgi:hypothetical protein
MAKRHVILSKGCIVVGSSPAPISNKYNMKRYKIRILLNSGTTSWFADEIIISNLEDEGGTSNNYIFCDDEGLYKYYPVANTIIEELEPLHPEL